MSQFIVGLTGGIGSGKTAVSDRFAELGIDVIDADVCAREVVEPGSDALSKIKEHFGDDVILSSGELNRTQLREKIFNDDSAKKWLNALLHPLIRQQMLKGISAAQSPYCILAVPLLLENSMQSMVNRVLVVDVSEQTQLERVKKRDNSSEELIRSIMASQISRDNRLALADDVVSNEGDLGALGDAVEQLHTSYLKLAAN